MSSFSLLDLPVEVRRMILECLLICSSTDKPLLLICSSAKGCLALNWETSADDLRGVFRKCDGVCTPILRTCSRLHGEGTTVLYNSNVLKFLSLRLLTDFMNHIGPRNFERIRKVELHCSYRFREFRLRHFQRHRHPKHDILDANRILEGVYDLLPGVQEQISLLRRLSYLRLLVRIDGPLMYPSKVDGRWVFDETRLMRETEPITQTGFLGQVVRHPLIFGPKESGNKTNENPRLACIEFKKTTQL